MSWRGGNGRGGEGRGGTFPGYVLELVWETGFEKFVSGQFEEGVGDVDCEWLRLLEGHNGQRSTEYVVLVS